MVFSPGVQTTEYQKQYDETGCSGSMNTSQSYVHLYYHQHSSHPHQTVKHHQRDGASDTDLGKQGAYQQNDDVRGRWLGGTVMELWQRHQSTHDMYAMLVMHRLQKPPPQHHKEPHTQTPKGPNIQVPHNNKPTTLHPHSCLSYSTATAHRHHHPQQHIHPRHINSGLNVCNHDVPQVMGLPQWRMQTLPQRRIIGTSYKTSFNIKTSQQSLDLKSNK